MGLCKHKNMKYHVMIRDSRVIKWQSISADCLLSVIASAVDVWNNNGGDKITNIKVYHANEDDITHHYRYSPEDSYSDRENLVENISLKDWIPEKYLAENIQCRK